MKYFDLAIRWSNKESAIRQLVKAGSVTVYGRPRYLKPGRWVAIVTKGNVIRVMFKAGRIEGPKNLKLISGKTRPNSYIIKADKRSVRKFDSPIQSPIKGWFAIGAYRYFHASKMKAITVSDHTGSPDDYIPEETDEVGGTVFRKHIEGIPGKPRNHPEAKLVEQYVQSLDPNTRFGHNYVRVDHLFVDLFDLTHWQLIEAKIDISRKVLRMAVGQLKDYKRYYKRPPSLAVLLSSRPADSCIGFLTDNHISVIWRNPEGSFGVRKWQE